MSQNVLSRLKEMVSDPEVFGIPGDGEGNDLEGRALAAHRADCVSVFKMLHQIAAEQWDWIYFPASADPPTTDPKALFAIGGGFLYGCPVEDFYKALTLAAQQSDEAEGAHWLMFMMGILSGAYGEHERQDHRVAG